MKRNVRTGKVGWIIVAVLILLGIMIRTTFAGYDFTAYILIGCAAVLSCYLLLPKLTKRKPKLAKVLLTVLSVCLGVGIVAAAVTGVIILRAERSVRLCGGTWRGRERYGALTILAGAAERGL